MSDPTSARPQADQALVNGAASVSALSGFDPSRWRTDDLPFEHRPMRQFIVVDGWREHSGRVWHRRYADTAYICREDQPGSWFGYRRQDLERIMRDGDMDGIDAVVGWRPCAGIGYAAAGDPNAIATEAGTAETPESVSVHEGAAIAKPLSSEESSNDR